MFHPGTILTLKEQREPTQAADPYTGEPRVKQKLDPRTGERVDVLGKDKQPIPVMLPFPWNRVEVIGRSPVTSSEDEWRGEDAVRVILKPLTDFAGNIEEPMGKVKQLYDVESVPEPPEVDVQPTLRTINATTAQAGPTPEEVFAQEAPGTPPKPGQTRGRTDPFADVKPEKGQQGTSPL